MSPILSHNPLVNQVVSGKAGNDLIEMLLNRELPLTEEEFLEAFVYTLKGADTKPRALRQLANISSTTKNNYVGKRECDHRVAYYILIDALNRQDPETLTRVIHNQALPPEFLEKIATHGNEAMLEALLSNQIKLIAYPQILEKMTANSHAGAFIRSRIREIQEDYLEKAPVEEIPAEAITEEVREIIAKEVTTEDSIEEDGELEDLVEQRSLTTLQRINLMTVSERVKLALTGSKGERMILIKDANKMVAQAVIESPKIGEEEVLLIVRNRSVGRDIIGRVAQNREWTKNYNIILELLNNPKTPVKDALGFIKKMHDRDLKMLKANKNASPVIRNLALNFFRQRERKKN